MTRPIIVASNRLHPAVATRLEAVGELHAPSGNNPFPGKQLDTLLPRAHAFMGFMTDCVDTRWLAQAPCMRIVAAALKGFDSYDVKACERAGVWLSIVPDLLTEPTAELALGLAIALGRHIRAGDAHVRSGSFTGWRPMLYGSGLAGATVGVVGLGAVGRAIIDRLQGFGTRQVLGVDPAGSDDRARAVPLHAALEESEFIFLAAPLTTTSRHLVDEEALRQVRPGQLMINIGRGSVVDEEAIASALDRQQLGGYAADVFEFEDWALPARPREVSARLRAHPHTVFTPHLGSGVASVRLAIEQRAADNIIAALNGETPPDAINRPRAR